MMTIALEKQPDLQFRIDSFAVPAAAREEFVQATQRTLAFISKLPGFLGHLVFEKTRRPTKFNLVSIAVWQNHEAIAAAAAKVRDYYEEIGFDTQATLERLGIDAELGNFGATRSLQQSS